MAATPQSILGTGVILPHDLHPDDTTVIYDTNGKPVDEMDYNDPDDECAADRRDYKRYIGLALTFYNDTHQTDYKAVRAKGGRAALRSRHTVNSIFIECAFTAVPSTTEGCHCAAVKCFSAELQATRCGRVVKGEEVVTSCRIVDGPKITACKFCDTPMNCDTSGGDKEVKRTNSEEDVPPPYSRYLADGVTLSDKAKVRVELPLLALSYYNKKKHADYKLVDALPCCISFESCEAIVAHCNFVARQNAPADASNKLFFAELKKRDGGWDVIACRVLRGKSTAGCHNCLPRPGKRVIHPTSGFRFGLYPERRLLRRRRC